MVRRRLAALLRRGYALSLALRDERTPGKAKAVALVALAWVVSPFDLDFVPLLGWVDDAAVVYLGSQLVERLSPAGLYQEFETQSPRTLRRIAALAVALAVVVVGASVALVWWIFLA